jgi:hypothetical protein
MRWKKRHYADERHYPDEIIPKSNQTNRRNRDKIKYPKTPIYDRPLSWLGTCPSIKGDGVKLV